MTRADGRGIEVRVDRGIDPRVEAPFEQIHAEQGTPVITIVRDGYDPGQQFRFR